MEASRRTVLVALLANLAVAMAKGIAALLTGSAGLFAETAHSVADSMNEVLLLVGVRSSERPADSSHPHAYGEDRYFWSLLSAFGIFVTGALLSIGEGIEAIRSPRRLESVWVGLLVLGLSAAFEGWSWLVSKRQISEEADDRATDVRGFIRSTSDPAPVAVFLEDSAALIGIGLAAGGLVLHAWTGSAIYDALASISVGLLLAYVAWRLVALNRRLIIGASASRRTVDRLVSEVERRPWITAVANARAVVIGPGRLALSLDVTVDERLATAEVAKEISQLRQDLLSGDSVSVADITLVPSAAVDAAGRRQG
jgi:cation diffusion facilitator family transporter